MCRPESDIWPKLQSLDQFRNCCEQVSFQTEVSHLEDGGFWILVDGHDDLRILHTGQVLDGAGDTANDIQLWRNDLAGLTDLQVVGSVARVHGSARSTDGGAQLVGQGVRAC